MVVCKPILVFSLGLSQAEQQDLGRQWPSAEDVRHRSTFNQSEVTGGGWAVLNLRMVFSFANLSKS